MLELHFLPYGRVDAILIGCNGCWAFVDGGYRKDGVKAVAYMKKLGLTHLDTYIATHRHRNHIGAAPVIIRDMHPAMIYYRGKNMFDRLLALASGAKERTAVRNANHTNMEIGEKFSLGGATFTCIGPGKIRKCSTGALMENYNSIILLMECDGQKVLLTGDTSDAILSKCDGIENATIYKNHHHNGRTGAKLLGRISPQSIVVCNTSPPAKSYVKSAAKIHARMFTAGKRGDGLVILR